MMAPLSNFRLATFDFPRDRRIGDCQVAIDTNWITALELQDAEGATGLGFALTLFGPPPSCAAQRDYVTRQVWPALVGRTPEQLIHRVAIARGGNARPVLYGLDLAIDQAMWDLAAKRAELPLFRYLGGDNPRPVAYASGLEFHLNDTAVVGFYEAARAEGYCAYKIKVGHSDVSWDIGRLQLVRDTVGGDAKLMADANEAWTVAETRARIAAYREVGINLDWIEDPILRSDFAGLRDLRHMLGGVRINAGEYLPTPARLSLIEAGAADVVQLNGTIGDGLRLAWAASTQGLPVALGNTNMNIGAHLAAALPEVDMVEDGRMNSTNILETPLQIEDGCFVLPETPGHGLSLNAEAAARLSEAD